MNIESRLRSVLLALLGVNLMGTAGYMLIEGWGFLDALYMTVITISTVGFAETHSLSDPGRIFAMLLIVGGVGAMMYSLTVFFQMLVEGHISDLLGKYTVKRSLRKMKNHFIVCGYGRVGKRVAEDLRNKGELTVVIESHDEKLQMLKERLIPFVPGNATEDVHLLSAGIEHARGLIVAMQDQASSVLVTLSARQLNPSLRIVSRCDHREKDDKLIIAGADAVVSPQDMGGERMALAVSEPDVMGYIHFGEEDGGKPMRVDRLRVQTGSPFCDVPVGEILVFSEFNLLLVGIGRGKDKLIFKPRPTEEVKEGDVLILVGAVDQLSLLKQMMSQMPHSNFEPAGQAPPVPTM